MTEAKTKRIQQRDVPTLPDGKYSIGEGLILRIQGGRRRFIFRYQLAGKRREIGLGSASDITIARAKQIALRLRRRSRRVVTLSRRSGSRRLRRRRAPSTRFFRRRSRPRRA